MERNQRILLALIVAIALAVYFLGMRQQISPSDTSMIELIAIFILLVALGTMVMISGTLYMLVLISYSPFGEHADIAGALDMFPLWAVLGAGCLVSSGLLLWNIQPVSDTKEVKI